MGRQDEEVKLLGFWVSPVVKRVEWALKLKSVEYEYVEEDIFNKSPKLLELHQVHKKVPMLVHGDKVIVESLLILEYVDETWKQCPLLPLHPYHTAMARFWASFAEDKLLRGVWMALCTQGEEKERTLKSAIEALEKIEGELKRSENKYFGGECIGYLDLALGWISYLLPIWEEVGSMKIVDPTRFPAITAWMNNFLEHPVIKHTLPPRDAMLAYFQWRSKEIGSLLASGRKG
ncbi:glutathione transferase [Sarracenia purpurea var. burkii]